LPLAPLDQRERLQRLPVSELHECPDVLFTHLARDANHGRLLDARMRVDDALDLPGRDVLAAAAQRVLLAAAIVKVTVLVGVAEVAGVDAAVAQDLRGPRRVTKIFQHRDAGFTRPHDDLADFARRERPALVVGDPALELRGWLADRPDAAVEVE